jgi:hypothetical protein
LARSEWLLIAALCGGCDAVFSVGDTHACLVTSFDHAKPEALLTAEYFSINWDENYAVLVDGGLPYEYHFDGMPTPIDLGPTVQEDLALSPEGDGLFWTTAGDPFLLVGAASHDGTTWTTGTRVPRGTFAGTPSADGFGVRHVLVRLRYAQPAVQEYVDDNGIWMPTGDPHDMPGDWGPNLTPNGLTVVWDDADGVHEATRTSIDSWFGQDTLVLAGAHRTPQLLGHCETLYTVDSGMLTRYRR